MSHTHRGPGPVPNRWLYCPRKSDTIIAERFLAFKTPLSEAYYNQMPDECVFTPDMVFGYCKTLRLKLGLWIDLTNTKRFYDRELIERNGAQYVKLQCRGHGETPSPEQTRSFIEIVEDFITNNPLDMIGVHCTHGFNRTGFLICSYLIQVHDYSVEAAISVFGKAREPGIYKQDYINELFRRYGDEEDIVQAPELPPWCFDSDENQDYVVEQTQVLPTSSKRQLDLDPIDQEQSGSSNNGGGGVGGLDDDDADNNDDEHDDGEVNAKKSKRRRREMMIKNAKFMDGVPGCEHFTEQPRLGELQRKVQNMCRWERNGFPGSQPVSMDRKNLLFLHDIPYRVSWKADGTRYMMLINKRNEIYFFDRNFSCFQVRNLTFLKADNLNEHLTDTLVDGEMVLEKINGHTLPRYLIYDIVKYCNQDIGLKDFHPNRVYCIRKQIIEPRHKAMATGVIDRNSEPFSVRQKDFWDIKTAGKILGEKFAKQLSHEPDGLIFQPSKNPYTAGATEDVLKWKPSNMNSVDFRLKIVKEGGVGIVPRRIGQLYVLGHDTYFAIMDKVPKTLLELDNKIIECTVNAQGKWEFMRERTDKSLPNSYSTAVSVCESIRYPITKSILLEFIDMHGFQDDNDKMPPPSSRHYQQHQQQQHHQQQQQHHQQQQQHHQQQQQYQHHQQHQNHRHQQQHQQSHQTNHH